MNHTLPIQACIPGIKQALKSSQCAVIQAPPGAGKTTRIPLALLEETWLGHKKIILLEPRRLAAIACARHMAGLLKEKTGQTIGYQIRLDRKIGLKTRIEVVTEGIFTRKIQNDPALKDIGIVIFDEFHERNIHSDLGLALCLETREALREDLRILVMSATMDVSSVSTLMGNAPVIVSKGKTYPVETIYVPPLSRQNLPVSIETACIPVIKHALAKTCGDILVFLPGVREILNLHSNLDKILDSNIRVLPLYGNLSIKDQSLAFAPSLPLKRKIVLATSIAETSITIEGINIVIDTGYMRLPEFSARTGMSRLKTLKVSKAAADQRKGRAGRTAPGKCYRLWSKYDQQALKPYTDPEILNMDLTGVALELAAWGVSDPGQLNWLNLPDKISFNHARQILTTLGALDDQGHITMHGKKIVSAGVHPRLAHMVIKAREKGQGFLACQVAALLNEKDFIRFDQNRADPDLRLRLEIMEAFINKQKIYQKDFKINKGSLKRVLDSQKKIAADFCIPRSGMDIEKAGMVLAYALPDRIAKKRNSRDNTFLMASGKGAYFTRTNPVSLNEYIVVAELDGNPRNARIFLAAPYNKKDFEHDFSQYFKIIQTICWDKNTEAVQAKEKIIFKKISVQEKILTKIDSDLACDILTEEIKKKGLDILPWTLCQKSLKQRAVFLKKTGQFPDLPDLLDPTLEKNLAFWLKPFLQGIFSFKQLEKMDLNPAFSSLLTWKNQQIIEKMAPTHITVPSGSKKPLKYGDKNGIFSSPILEVRIQEMFGRTSEIKIAGNKIRVTLHLLSPAGRPVQITKDLAGFWAVTYDIVKKDLKGRYPKHFWPDDPLTAQPTNRVRPKKT